MFYSINYFNEFPLETKLEVFSYLNVKELNDASLVCQNWRALTGQNEIWKRLSINYVEDFLKLNVEKARCKRHSGWKGVFCHLYMWNRQENPSFMDLDEKDVFQLLKNRLLEANERGLLSLQKNLDNRIQDLVRSVVFQNGLTTICCIPPLTLLILNDNRNWFKLLVEAGFNILEKALNQTLMHFAAKKANFSAVELLLKRGIDIDVRGEDGMSPLQCIIEMEAEEEYRLNISKFLIEKGANLLEEGAYYETPLHTAARCDSTTIAMQILSKNVPINIKNQLGETPLHTASFYGSTQMVHFLINHGAEVI